MASRKLLEIFRMCYMLHSDRQCYIAPLRFLHSVFTSSNTLPSVPRHPHRVDTAPSHANVFECTQSAPVHHKVPNIHDSALRPERAVHSTNNSKRFRQ
jgi:hypothetical protein